jgi:hypothetical protein
MQRLLAETGKMVKVYGGAEDWDREKASDGLRLWKSEGRMREWKSEGESEGMKEWGRVEE